MISVKIIKTNIISNILNQSNPQTLLTFITNHIPPRQQPYSLISWKSQYGNKVDAGGCIVSYEGE